MEPLPRSGGVAMLCVVGAEVKDCGGSYNCNFGRKQEQLQELCVHQLPGMPSKNIHWPAGFCPGAGRVSWVRGHCRGAWLVRCYAWLAPR
jgi:hypothetical protein